ncbi:putative membrane protein [Wickerhamomyces ciferrii]|uniref:Membrane protein n=1 Tax=Wickerhamomyces ciferrii (strain ATCC 14091 / BCRC 22168 / CBS 111 / JCM 3599 / NBRC 0793 / NRRL Y-1031 F-60-10) TaxID=1206466 RepID=K0KMW8_WICCF|nr:uncharacterized protein BN7_2018 [Wickerhamomyces ciferrii]CCH42473.1 putative membrane protein [Wickerhamomyces ciferrii]
MGYQAVLIALSTIAILLLIPPFIWHAKAINIPAITLIIWLLIMDIKIFIDAIIWGRDNFSEVWNGHGYCDVMVKISVGANVGISSSVAGIMFNLYRILKADKVIPELKSTKKIVTDLLISLLTPIFVMGLNYLIQVRRYSIFQYSGCQNVLSPTWLTVILYTVWMVVWSLTGVIYAILILFTFFKKRKDVKDILRCTNSGLNLVKFSKLLIFCIIVILVMFPFSMYMFTNDLNKLQSTYDFAQTHSKIFWQGILYLPFKQPYLVTWVYLSISYVVFIFFGLGSDAINMYIDLLSKIGFKPIIEYIRHKRDLYRQQKADESVSRVFHNREQFNGPMTGTSGGTQFDIEMQKIIDEEYDDKSPTSTAVSNIFTDQNEINRHKKFQHLSGFDESLFDGLDEEDLNYINNLYEEDINDSNQKSSNQRITSKNHGKSDDLEYGKDSTQVEVTTPISQESSATTAKESDFDFVYKVQHKGI